MIIQTQEQLKQFLQTFNKQCFAFDTETTSLSWFEQEIEGISIYDGQHSAYILGSTCRYLMDLFDKAQIIIGHNLVFDFKALMRLWDREYTNRILKSTKLVDTELAEYVINSENPKGLKVLAHKYLNRSPLTWKEAQRFPHYSQEFADYAIADAINTWDVWTVQKAIIAKDGLEQVFRIECDFIPVQIEMETSGILVNQDLLKKQETQLDLLKCQLEGEMIDALGIQRTQQGNLYGNADLIMPLDFGSPAAVVSYIQRKMGIQLTLKTEGGNYSIGKKTIEQLLNTHPFFRLFQKYRAVMKLLTGFIRPYWDLIKPDGRIYPSFRHVRSGRCVAYNPNLQQQANWNELVPEINIRELFIAGKNNKFLRNDYDQQELRILAHITGDKNLIAAFKANKDIHLDTANKVFKLNIPEECLIKTHSKYKEYRKKFEKQRSDIKPTNFGIPYGKYTEYNQKWFAAYPQVKTAMQQCKEFQLNNKYTITWAGRRRYYTTFRSTDLRSGFNMLIQGTGADMAIKAAGELWKYLRTFVPTIRIILLVHDEVILEGPENDLKQQLTAVKAYLENTMRLSVPLVVESKIVSSYGEK